MAAKNLTNYRSLTEFATDLHTYPSTISKLKKAGTIPVEAFEKSGRMVYVHAKKATAALKAAPLSSRGAVPTWASAVMNTEYMARQKAIAKAAKASAKKATASVAA